MKPLPLVLAALVATAPAASATLDDHRWHDRLLLVFAPDAASVALRTQRQSIAAATGEYADRDVRVVEVVGSAVRGTGETAAALRIRFAVPPAAFRALLIGKDGTVALRAAAPLATPTLVAAIDAMPMRRAEMARAGRSGLQRR